MGHEGDFWIGELGWKYKLSNVQAAIGLGQIERADEHVEAKRRIFGWYEEELRGVPGIELAREAGWARSIYWMSSLRVRPEAGIDRSRLRALLAEQGIDTRPVFPAISQYPMWSPRQEPAPTAYRIGCEGVNLPSGVRLGRHEVARVGAAIRAAVDSAAGGEATPTLEARSAEARS
jgi:perosamine synthetase